MINCRVQDMSSPNDSVLFATSVITMDPNKPRADAIGIRDGRIVAVGTRGEVSAALPSAEVTDLDDAVLLPGFIDAHSHPVGLGLALAPPSIDIRPFVVPTWVQVQERMIHAEEEAADGEALFFYGLDPLLHNCEPPGSAELDAVFGDRIVLVYNISGHALYATSSAMAAAGVAADIADPVGGSFQRNADGSLTGRTFESGAIALVVGPLLERFDMNPALQIMFGYSQLARAGITTAAELALEAWHWPFVTALAAEPNCPIRLAAYHVSIEAGAIEPLDSPLPEMVWKQGVKLWADGSSMLGNISVSFEFIDSPVTRRAGIEANSQGAMNYSREQLRQLLDQIAPAGWQAAIHAHGDRTIDVVLDSYEQALRDHDLISTDHRWRIEHCGAMTAAQFKRAAQLGVEVSLFPALFFWWGDVMVGGLFSEADGAQWGKLKSAFDAGLQPSFHNDGTVTPPAPLLSMQTAMTRRVHGSGTTHAPEECVSLDQALAAYTTNPARQLSRDHDLGSIEVGKLADLVSLSHDPYQVDPEQFSETIRVLGTWLSGRRVAQSAPE